MHVVQYDRLVYHCFLYLTHKTDNELDSSNRFSPEANCEREVFPDSFTTGCERSQEISRESSSSGAGKIREASITGIRVWGPDSDGL